MQAEAVLRRQPGFAYRASQSRMPVSASAYRPGAPASAGVHHRGASNPARPTPSPRTRGAHEQLLLASDTQKGGGGQSVEWFFDRVDHDILIDRLQKRIGDFGVIRLIRTYLNSGIMDDGVVQTRTMGTPQGGPLTPRTQKITSSLS